MSIVEVSDVRKSYGNVEVLRGVTFNVEAGQVAAVVGRSGSGKSTMLRCLNGLETIGAGRISVASHQLSQGKAELRALRKDVGIVFQSYNLFPHLTVEENIMLAPRLVRRVSKAQARSKALDVLKMVGLVEKAEAYPDQLSGGQQQRVAIARSLAMDPKVMLFDEVTSALDPELTGEVLRTMTELARAGMTMIVVTHEMAFARDVSDILIFMHEGKIWETGPSKGLFQKPQTAEFQRFLRADAGA